MAIDTRARRMSVTGRKPFHKAILPDGTIDASDRAHIAWLYSGISLVVSVVSPIRNLDGALTGRGLDGVPVGRNLDGSPAGRGLSETPGYRDLSGSTGLRELE